MLSVGRIIFSDLLCLWVLWVNMEEESKPETQLLLPFRVNSLVEFLPLIPFYDGSSSFEKFLSDLDEIATHGQWDEKSKILTLKLKLRGEAREFLDSQQELRSSGSYEEIVQGLRERFQKNKSIAASISRLTSAYQLPTEDVRGFFSRIEGLSYACMPERDSQTKVPDTYRLDLLLSAAKQGIKPEILRGIASSGLNTYEEFKQHAQNYEESLGLINSPLQVTALAEKMPVEEDKFERLQKQIESLAGSVSNLQATISQMGRESDPPHRGAYGYSRREVPSFQRRSENSRGERDGSGRGFFRGGTFRPRCSRCNRQGHRVDDCDTPFCSFCQIFGHEIEWCRNRKRDLN